MKKQTKKSHLRRRRNNGIMNGGEKDAEHLAARSAVDVRPADSLPL